MIADQGFCDRGFCRLIAACVVRSWGVGNLSGGVWVDCQDILTRVGLKLVKLGIFPKLRLFAGGLRGWKLRGVGVWTILRFFSLSW